MKGSRYRKPLEKPNLIEKFEEEDKRLKKEKEKKEWIEGGEFKPEDNPNGLAEESSFKVLFPQYREPYFKENEKDIIEVFKTHTLDVSVDFVKGFVTTTTTKKTYDPFIIIKGRDVLKLMSRGIALEQAKRVFQDDITTEIIKLSSYCSREAFINRRQRLIGQDGATLKAIELLSDSYILIQGKTASIIGTYHGIKEATNIIIDCMKNIHPIYNINRLMVKKELEKNPNMKDKDWNTLLPQYVKSKQKKVKKIKKKKEYTPFPPEPEESKIDKEIRSGVYFLSEEDKKSLKKKEIEKRQKDKVEEKKAKKEELYKPKEEIIKKEPKKEKTEYNIQPVKRKRDENFDAEKFIEKKKK